MLGEYFAIIRQHRPGSLLIPWDSKQDPEGALTISTLDIINPITKFSTYWYNVINISKFLVPPVKRVVQKSVPTATACRGKHKRNGE